MFLLFSSIDHAIAAFVIDLDDESKTALQAHLVDLLASDASDQNLESLWREYGAQIGLVDSQGIRQFFEEITRALTSRASDSQQRR